MLYTLQLYLAAMSLYEDKTGHLKCLITASLEFAFIQEVLTLYCDICGVCKCFSFPARCFWLVRRVMAAVSEQVYYFLYLVLPSKTVCSEVPVFFHTLCDTISRNTQVLRKPPGTGVRSTLLSLFASVLSKACF